MSVVALRRLSALAVVSLGVLIACLPAGKSVLAQAKAPISPKDQPIVLFNGKDLKPFHTWMRDTQLADPRHIFNVATDQGRPVIYITGDGYGGLVTNDEYTNYHLIAEYRWGEKTYGDRLTAARDNGILIHGQGPDGGSLVQVVDGFSPWLTSIECQIEEGAVGDLLVLGGEKDGKPIDIGATVAIEMREGRGPGATRVQRPVWKKGGEPRRFVRGAPGANRATPSTGISTLSDQGVAWRERSGHARPGMDTCRDHCGWRQAHAHRQRHHRAGGHRGDSNLRPHSDSG